MKIITGDLLAINKGVIIHQVNNRKVMGAGIAKSIRGKYLQHFTDYRNSRMVLGNLVCTRINRKFGIIGMISQDGWGRDSKIYTDYSAFSECLRKIATLYERNKTVEYYMPYGIGCGLANGDWNVISGLIDEICPFITVVKLVEESDNFYKDTPYDPNF